MRARRQRPPPPSPADRPEIADQTINGNLVVPSNTTFGFGDGCNLENVVVNGSVTIAPGGELDADIGTSFTTIKGALIANQAFDIDLFHVTVYGATVLNGAGADSTFEASVFRGPVTVENTPAGSSSYSISFDDSTVGGSLRVAGNATPIEVFDNHVTGALAVENNSGGTIFDGIASNAVGGALVCSSNASPFFGSANTAAVKLGQCAAF